VIAVRLLCDFAAILRYGWRQKQLEHTIFCYSRAIAGVTMKHALPGGLGANSTATGEEQA
jgi:hypothetical protein